MKMLEVEDDQTQLAELINAAMNGEEVIISRDGKPVAKLEGLEELHDEAERPYALILRFKQDLEAALSFMERNISQVEDRREAVKAYQATFKLSLELSRVLSDLRKPKED